LSFDLPGTLLLHHRGNRVARIDGPEQVHFRHKFQERRIEGAGLSIHGPTTTSARIRDEHVDSTPRLDDPRHHCLDSLVVTDIDLDADGSTARRLDLSDGPVGGHVFGFDLEFLIGVQVKVGDRDFGPQTGEPFCVGSSKTSGRARHDRNLTVQLVQGGLSSLACRISDSGSRSVEGSKSGLPSAVVTRRCPFSSIFGPMAISATSSDDTTLSRPKSAPGETTLGTLWTRRRLTEQAARLAGNMMVSAASGFLTET
jgi:hypothetical protein